MRGGVGCDVQTGKADCGRKGRLLRAEYKVLEREGREGCGAQTGWFNFEKKNNSFASRREGLRVRMRVRCDAHIGGANFERKSRWGRPDWVRPETPLERPRD